MTVQPISIAVNQHDSFRLYFPMVNQDGEPIQWGACEEIIFSISPNITSDSSLRKTKTNGDLTQVAENEFFLDLTYLETGALQPGNQYCEVRVYIGTGRYTIGAGVISVTDTQIGDYP